MKYKTQIGEQVHEALRRGGWGSMRKLSLKLFGNETSLAATLGDHPRTWGRLEAIAAAADATFVLVPNERLSQVQALLVDHNYTPALATPTGVASRLVDLITRQVMAEVYQALNIAPLTDEDRPALDDPDTDGEAADDGTP